MTSVIGGNYKCFIHDIETADVNEWNDHCTKTGHTDSGECACKDCGINLSFNNIPFQKITSEGKKIELRCPTCNTNFQSQDIQKSVQLASEKYEQAEQQRQVNEQADIQKQVEGNSQNQDANLKNIIIK